MTTLAEQANKATVREACELLGISPDTLQAAIRRGAVGFRYEKREITFVRVQTVKVVDLEEVEALAAAIKARKEDGKRDYTHEDIPLLMAERGIKRASAARIVQYRAKKRKQG